MAIRPDTRQAPFPLREIGADPGQRRFLSDLRELSIITSVDNGWMHLSVAHPKRYPTWEEIHALRDWWFPEGMEVVMVLPRAEDYVNLHPNCFHLWQSACGRESR